MTALLNWKKYCQYADVPGVQLGGAGSARRGNGEVPPSQQGSLFLIQKLPHEEMQLLLTRSSSSSALPPPPALLCNGISPCSPLSALGWVLQGFLACPSLGVCHPGGSLGTSLGTGPLGLVVAGVTWLFGDTQQMVLAAGLVVEPVQKSLPVLSVMPCAARSCPPSPLRFLYKQELNG